MNPQWPDPFGDWGDWEEREMHALRNSNNRHTGKLRTKHKVDASEGDSPPPGNGEGEEADRPRNIPKQG